jgi:hypothetical protein
MEVICHGVNGALELESILMTWSTIVWNVLSGLEDIVRDCARILCWWWETGTYYCYMKGLPHAGYQVIPGLQQ